MKIEGVEMNLLGVYHALDQLQNILASFRVKITRLEPSVAVMAPDNLKDLIISKILMTKIVQAYQGVQEKIVDRLTTHHGPKPSASIVNDLGLTPTDRQAVQNEYQLLVNHPDANQVQDTAFNREKPVPY